MKKVFAVVISLVLLLGVACAEGLDYAAMTDDELHTIVSLASNELLKRELVANGETLVFEQDGISLYLTGKYGYTSFGENKEVLKLEGIVVNDTSDMIDVRIDNVAVNGWEVYGGIIQKVGAGNKKKDTFEIRIYDADIHSFEEIETLQFIFRTTLSEGNKKLFTLDPITIHYNQE